MNRIFWTIYQMWNDDEHLWPLHVCVCYVCRNVCGECERVCRYTQLTVRTHTQRRISHTNKCDPYIDNSVEILHTEFVMNFYRNYTISFGHVLITNQFTWYAHVDRFTRLMRQSFNVKTSTPHIICHVYIIINIRTLLWVCVCVCMCVIAREWTSAGARWWSDKIVKVDLCVCVCVCRGRFAAHKSG